MKNFFQYNPTKLLFGKGVNRKIGEEVAKAGLKKVAFLYGGGSIKKNFVYEQTTKSLKRFGVEFVEIPGVRPNPTLDHAEKAVDICRREKVEAVVAAGGGSVVDEGKSVAAGFYLDELWDAFSGKAEIRKALPLFAVLTMSGTGTEMNPVAVLSSKKHERKGPIKSKHIFPKVSFVDPEAQYTLPWHQTVNGGIDAVSHIMEYYFLGEGDEITLSVNEAIIKSIINSLDKLQKDPKKYQERANLVYGTTIAFNQTSAAGLLDGDWATHAIEHALSLFDEDVAHGAGLAVLFPAWIRYCADSNPATFERWAKNVWRSTDVEEALDKMIAKYSEWKAPVSLAEIGFNEKDFSKIARNAAGDSSIGVVKELNENDVVEILKIAAEQK